MKRRSFIAMTGGALAAVPLRAKAQSPPKMLRVATATAQPRTAPFWLAFERRLVELGYVEGRNFAFDHIQIASPDVWEAGYREVVARKPDILIASGPELSLKSAMAATDKLPIVMVAVDYDPFVRGFVKDLARPGANITGPYLRQIDLTVKRLNLLKDAFTEMSGVTVLWDGLSVDQWSAAQTAGAKLGLRMDGIELRERPYDYDNAFAQAATDKLRYVSVMVSPFFFLDRVRLSEAALRHRIVSMFGFREWVDAGGLLSYGTSLNSMFRLAADYVDRIARGANPAELPIEQPTKFEFVLNQKTAAAIGLTIPDSLLARADEVIE